MLLTCVAKSVYIFTFHYGSITIPGFESPMSHLKIFTFHYGSITISISQPLVFLAIQFTFHYGSITMQYPRLTYNYELHLHSIMVQLLFVHKFRYYDRGADLHSIMVQLLWNRHQQHTG